MISIPAQLGVQASIAHTDVAAVTAIFLTIIEIGGAVGSAISGAVWTGNLLPKLEKYLPPSSQVDAVTIFGNLTIAKSYLEGTAERVAIDRSYQETMDILLIIAVCLAVPLVPLSLVMRNYRLDDIGQKVKGTIIGRDRQGEMAPGALIGEERQGQAEGLEGVRDWRKSLLGRSRR